MRFRKGGYAGILLVALGAGLWGTDAVLRVPLLGSMSPPEIVFAEHLALLVYSIPAVVLGWRFFRSLRVSQWLALLVIGWGGSGLATILFTAGLSTGNPTTVILLQKTQPLFAIILAHILLGERLRWAYWPSFAVAVSGAYLVSFGTLEPFGALGSAQLLPAAFAIGAALLWGFSTVLGRFVLKDMPFHTLTGARLFLALPFVWFVVVVGGSFQKVGAGFASHPALILLLALIPGLAGLLFYYRGLSGTRASYATLAELAFPATTVILNWAFLGVGITAIQASGFILLWAAIFVLGNLHTREPEVPEPYPRRSTEVN